MTRVEQPVGTGFSIGTPKATSQSDISRDFLKMFKNFEKTFGIKNYKIYVTGESYAGRYVPYISGAMIDANDTEYYDVKGEFAVFVRDAYDRRPRVRPLYRRVCLCSRADPSLSLRRGQLQLGESL